MRTVPLRCRALWLFLPVALFACGGSEKVADSGDGQPLPEQLTIQQVLYKKDGSAVVVLLRPDGRVVQLPVAECASDVVYEKIHDIPFPRPLTHDLFKAIADELGLEVPKVTIDVVGDSAVAHVSVARGVTVVDLDASPGDALAVAQRTAADIVGTPALLEQLTLRLEDRSESTAPAGKPALGGQPAPAARQSQSQPVPLSFLAFTRNPVRGGVGLLFIDADSTSVFTMIVGFCQGLAFYQAVQEVQLGPFPAHRLLYNLVEAGNGAVTHAGVIAIQDHTFIGELGIRGDGGDAAIDARPSDAVTLAALAGAPVLIDADLLAEYREDPASYLQQLEDQGGGGKQLPAAAGR